MRLEGRISVKAAMLAGNRTVSRIYVRDDLNDRDTSFILHRAEERGIPIERMSEAQINEMAQGKTHGGILADAGERTFQELSACLENDCPFVVMLEGVEDPFNLGYVIRSLYSAGCTGLILRNRDWSWSENTIVRSSAGAYEYMNVILSDDMAETVRILKQHGLYAYAAMRRDAISYFEAQFDRPILLCIGGEMRGLSSAVLKECDQNIYIPYANDFRAALNAAGASAALGFEVMRQRSTRR
ncbi:MAG TPA: RNA methyltransferase [Erysipelotrichaceae bacterium]|nr:RNA methyltransferase [Erysipelotrichaceae bacterium]